MKIHKLIGLLSAVLFTSIINLNAAITVQKVWQPESGLAPLRARLPFMQFVLSSDTTERVNGLSVKTTGPSGDRLIVKRGDGETVGMAWIAPQDTATATFIPLSLVVRAEWPEYLMLYVDRGQVMDSAYIGAAMTAEVIAVWTDTTVSGEFPITGARYTANSSLQIGRIASVARGDGHQNVTAGPNQVLGSIKVSVGSQEGFRVYDFTVDFYSTGGDPTQIRDLLAVDQNGEVVARGFGPRIQEQGGERFATFVFSGDGKGGGFIFPPDTTTALVFRGDTTHAFDRGGTLALETDISQWSMRGITYGYESAVSSYGSVMLATRFIRVPRLDVSTTSPQYLPIEAGISQLRALQIKLDATQSSEDILVTQISLLVVTLPQWTRDLARLSLYDGSVLVGWNHSVFPFENGIARFSVGFPGGVVVPKGTAKIITVALDVSSNASGFYGIGLTDQVYATVAQSGKKPGLSIITGYTILHAIVNKG